VESDEEDNSSLQVNQEDKPQASIKEHKLGDLVEHLPGTTRRIN